MRSNPFAVRIIPPSGCAKGSSSRLAIEKKTVASAALPRLLVVSKSTRQGNQANKESLGNKPMNMPATIPAASR